MKVKLKELGVISTGNTPSKNVSEFYASEDIGFVKPDIISDSQIDYIAKTTEYLSEAARAKARIVKKDSVFVTCIGSIGKVGIAKGDEFAFNQQINAIEPNEKIISKYLAYSILANKKKLQSIANAPVVPIINKTKFGEFEIDITDDVDEQARIVELLDKVCSIIADRKIELEKLDDLIKARFVEMFDGKGYSTLKWNEVFNTTTGKLDSNAMVENGEYPFFTCAKEVFRIDKYAFDQEALLLVGNNAAGKYDVKYYKGKFNAYQRTYVLGLKEKWSYQLFRYQLEDKLAYLQQQSLGGLTKYLTLKILGELEFIVPPMDKQNEFADFVQQIDKSKVAVQKALDEAQLLFDSLMQKYFG